MDCGDHDGRAGHLSIASIAPKGNCYSTQLSTDGFYPGMSYMRLLVLSAFSLLAFGFANPCEAILAYDADFSGMIGVEHTTSSVPPTGPHSVSGPNWTFSYAITPSTDSSLNLSRTNLGSFISRDWGGEAQVVSSSIDLTLASTIDIEWLGDTVGGAVFNGSSERFEWFYILDSGSPVVQSTTSDGSLNLTLSGIDVSSVSAVEVGFLWDVNGGGDGFNIDSLTVNATLAAVPEPSAFLLGSLLTGVAGLAVTRRRRQAGSHV